MRQIDLNNPVIQLCIQGSEAEFRGERDLAHASYLEAWNSARDDYDACIAAHYVARHQEDPAEKLRWNRIALDRANEVADGRVQAFYPSLYLCLGESYELLGVRHEAERYFALADELIQSARGTEEAG